MSNIYQDVKELLKNIGSLKRSKITDACREIYKSAQEMMNQEGKYHDAEYISNLAMNIYKLMNSQIKANDKSIDTMMLELEEREINFKLTQFGHSFVTESESALNQEDKSLSKFNSDGESMIVQENVKQKSNLQNLNHQFRFNHVIQAIQEAKESNRKTEGKAEVKDRRNQMRGSARQSNHKK